MGFFSVKFLQRVIAGFFTALLDISMLDIYATSLCKDYMSFLWKLLLLSPAFNLTTCFFTFCNCGFIYILTHMFTITCLYVNDSIHTRKKVAMTKLVTFTLQ